MSNDRSRLFPCLWSLFLALSVSACGGGGVSVAAPGVGSGGTGAPIGSGGTGIAIGPITGFGSIIVNNVHYNIDGITPSIEDATELKLGMVVRVASAVSGGATTGMATSVNAAAELRGAIEGMTVDAATLLGTLKVQGVEVTVDRATIYDGFTSLNSLSVGQFVQVYGLPQGSAGLRATRMEKIAAPTELITTGPVASLNASSSTFRIGASTLNFGAAAFSGMTAPDLSNGLVVRVRGHVSGGVFVATKIQRWQEPVAGNTTLSFAGLVSGYTSVTRTFTVADVTVDASAAAFAGGDPNNLGDGDKVELTGNVVNGVLYATKVQFRQQSDDNNATELFSALGPITQFVSPSNFQVKGLTIDASGAGVVFVNGSAANLANAVTVSVSGNQVVDGVLIATQVTF